MAERLAPDEIVSALAAVDLPAPAEIIDWFGWHNGPDVPAGVGRYVTASGIADMDYQSLGDCLNELTAWRSIESIEWQPGWFPLLRGRAGTALVAMLDAESETCKTGVFDPEFPFAVATDSIATLVAEAVERIERGEVQWIELGGTGYWGTPPPRLPDP